MKNNAFSAGHLKLIISIGTCSSPGGARAPLSRVASQLSSDMSHLGPNFILVVVFALLLGR